LIIDRSRFQLQVLWQALSCVDKSAAGRATYETTLSDTHADDITEAAVNLCQPGRRPGQELCGAA
jgi:hypothetical protein